MEAVRLQRRQGRREFRPPPPLRQAVLPWHHGLGYSIRRCSSPARFRSSSAYHRRVAGGSFVWAPVGGRASGRAGAFCANAGDAMIPSMINTTIAMMAMYLLEGRIQILHSNRVPAHHGFGLADSAVVVPLFQQVRERYRIDSTFIPGGRDASAFSTIGPVICTSWPPWKFSIS